MPRRFLLVGERGIGIASGLRVAAIALSAALGAYVAPASAQEWSGGAMNPATVSGPMATQAAAEAQANRRSDVQRKVKGSPTRSREICTDARGKIAAGDDNPRLSRLLALCAKGGY